MYQTTCSSKRYPDLIHAAVSSSGPLNAKLDFYEYYETVYDSLGTTGNGAECNELLTEAFETAEDMLKVRTPTLPPPHPKKRMSKLFLFHPHPSDPEWRQRAGLDDEGLRWHRHQRRP